ncbi:MAG: hypothetical protein P8182_09345 [Deltaproteobacteria bacterium]
MLVRAFPANHALLEVAVPSYDLMIRYQRSIADAHLSGEGSSAAAAGHTDPEAWSLGSKEEICPLSAAGIRGLAPRPPSC